MKIFSMFWGSPNFLYLLWGSRKFYYLFWGSPYFLYPFRGSRNFLVLVQNVARPGGDRYKCSLPENQAVEVQSVGRERRFLFYFFVKVYSLVNMRENTRSVTWFILRYFDSSTIIDQHINMNK